MEKRPFFRAATAGLGKYHTGGYGRIGVYRVKVHICQKWVISNNSHYKVNKQVIRIKVPIFKALDIMHIFLNLASFS